VVQIEPDVGIPDLLGRLGDDSKRLIGDKARLARLEMRESVRIGMRGMLWLALGFGIGVIGLVALTVLLTVVIGNDLLGKAWAGALIAGGIELIIGGALILVGSRILKRTDYTLDESRQEVRETAAWISRERES
jgi:hypothetical protein